MSDRGAMGLADGYDVRVQLGALFGLASSAAFGLCDFVAGQAARRLSFWWVTLVSLTTSVLGAWVVVVVRDESPTLIAVVWSTAAGIGAATGATALYRGYGRAEMAVAGPLSAVGAAALPAVVGAALGDRLPPLGSTGVLLALPAIWLMSSTGSTTARVRAGVTDGLLSGAGFALEFVGLERAGNDSGMWPVAVSQSTALILVAMLVAILRPGWRRGAQPSALAAAAGLLSLLATALYFLAAHAGMLTVAAVLASLYPGVTVVLAVVLLHERPDRRQVAGLFLAAVAVALVVIA
jgi:drug/metabolite transporter (DMT)-like permease